MTDSACAASCRISGHRSPTLRGSAEFRVDDRRELELHGWVDRSGELGPGDDLFVMFDDPDRHHVELSSEIENSFDDLADYQRREWRPEQRTVNRWGPAPPWRAPREAELPASESGTT
jgi:hypothetical protein